MFQQYQFKTFITYVYSNIYNIIYNPEAARTVRVQYMVQLNKHGCQMNVFLLQILRNVIMNVSDKKRCSGNFHGQHIFQQVNENYSYEHQSVHLSQYG